MSPEDAKKMLDDISEKSNKIAESQIKGLPKKIENSLLSDRQIAKKIISFKSPKLTDDDLNLIVYGKDLRKELGASYRSFFSENENLNPDVISKDKKSIFKPLSEDSPVFDEVRKLKIEVKDGFYILEQKTKDLGKDVAKLGVMVGSTIPAGIILVAPPSFNVPGALTLTMNLINAISGINQKMKDFTPALRVVEKLKYVLPDDEVENIVKPLKVIIESINTLSSTIGKLQLPNFSEEKEKQAIDAKNKMDTLDSKINSLKLSDFSDYSNPSSALDDEKKRLTSLKEDLSKTVQKLLK